MSATLQSGQIAFVDFYRQEGSRKIHLNLLVPIPDHPGGGRPLGVVSLRLDPEVYLYPFIRRWPEPSRTAETLLIRREGNDALFLNDLRFQTNAALNLRIPLTSQEVPAVKAVLGRQGIAEGRDYRKVPVLAALRPIPDSPWFLVAKMDIGEVYEPMEEMRWLIILLVVALLAGSGVGVGLLWRQQRLRFYREQYRAAEALRRAHDELEQRVRERTQEVRVLSAQLLSAQEEERKTIALDLHDGIGGLLSAIKYRIEASPDFNRREELVTLLQGAMEECRRIQMALRPPLLDDLGLLATLSWLIREFQGRAAALHIEKHFTVEESEVPEKLRMVIFRIAQEALNNIIKYSGAGEAGISLEKADGRLTLEVRDNGQGFQVGAVLNKIGPERGSGLAGMKERTELAGGTFSVASAPTRGTVIRAVWSVTSSEEPPPV